MPPWAWAIFVAGGIGVGVLTRGWDTAAEFLDSQGFDIPGYTAAAEEGETGTGGGAPEDPPQATTIGGGSFGDPAAEAMQEAFEQTQAEFGATLAPPVPDPTAGQSIRQQQSDPIIPSEPVTGGGAPEKSPKRDKPSNRHRRRQERQREQNKPRPSFRHPERGEHRGGGGGGGRDTPSFNNPGGGGNDKPDRKGDRKGRGGRHRNQRQPRF